MIAEFMIKIAISDNLSGSVVSHIGKQVLYFAPLAAFAVN